MKISELIYALEQEKQKHGDLECICREFNGGLKAPDVLFTRSCFGGAGKPLLQEQRPIIFLS
jgi:hypothetical protein